MPHQCLQQRDCRSPRLCAAIFSGWGALKLKILGPHAIAGLNRFVVYLALPALLFDIIGQYPWQRALAAGLHRCFPAEQRRRLRPSFLVRLRWRGCRWRTFRARRP